MKRNAILVASILFIAGCASDQNYRRASSSDYYDYHHHATLSTEMTHRDAQGRVVYPVTTKDASDEISADSSVRGGSVDARGYNRTMNEAEGSVAPMNPAYQADSSVRGGSIPARDREWNDNPEPSGAADARIKADSSIRGGSMEARGYKRFSATDRHDESVGTSATYQQDSSRSSDQWENFDGSVLIERGAPELTNQDFGQGGSERDRGALSDSNYNPSDDLMRDDQLNSSTGVSARATTQSDSSTDIAHDSSGAIESEASGRAASVEKGSSSSSEELSLEKAPEPQVGITSQSPNWLMRENRALGVGSAATSEQASSQATVSGMSDEQLAQQVKATLTSESTGTQGLMRQEVARNITVWARDGVVTLKGSVPSQEDKEMIEIRAREMTGVSRVNNQLTVSPASDPDQRDLTKGHDLEERTDQLQP